MVKAASTWDFESDCRLKFKALEHEHNIQCYEWNAECTLKLTEVVASARQQLKLQSTAADATLKDKPFAEWFTLRSLAVRPLYWEISSDAYTSFKKWYEGEHDKVYFGVRRYED